MTTPQITIHDCVTGETITRDFNAAELAQYEMDKAQTDKNAADKAKADADKASARTALLAKLGITADEAKLLLG